MPQCIICHSDTSLLSQKKSLDGYLCGSCVNKVPRVFHSALSLYNTQDIQLIMDYEEQMKKKGFSATSSYGKLHLDEMNGLIAICDKIDSDGKPIGNADIFNCVYLDNIGLYPVNPRQSKKDVVCDVEFQCVYNYPKMKFKLNVRQNVKCDFKQINKTQATWSEPGELSMFRNMLDQTIKTSVKKAMEERERGMTPYDFDMMKARASLHVYEGCSKELVHRQYENLKRLYETGGYSKEDSEMYISALTYYYNMLMQD